MQTTANSIIPWLKFMIDTFLGAHWGKTGFGAKKTDKRNQSVHTEPVKRGEKDGSLEPNQGPSEDAINPRGLSSKDPEVDLQETTPRAQTPT